MGGIYIASTSTHGPRWKAFREEGYPIISAWIDESGQGETSNWADLWDRCVREAASADVLVVYVEEGEILKWALVEMGAALAHGKYVFWVGPDVLSATRHRGVRRMSTARDALDVAMHLVSPETRAAIAEAR